mmetsp:Transcript_5778/g.13654  ORF Transcript_5778/g.13654 Transcript_5778/m.13654 type:complete len:365 (+) Transcript_5778:418-1512(+)
MLQVFERLLVNLCVQDVVDGIHLGLPVLLIHVTLLLHLADGIAVLLDVHLVGGALHRQPVDLLTQLQDVTLVFAQATLHATHAQIQCSEATRGFGTAQLSLLLHSPNLLKGLLLLLADLVLEASFRVGHIALEVAANHGDLVEAVAEGVLRRVQRLLGGRQVLVGEVNAPVQGIHGLVCIARDLGLRLLQVGLHGSDVVADGGQNLIDLAAAGIHVQAQGGDHITDSLNGSVQVVVGLLPSHIVHLGVQLRVHLVLQVDDVLRQVLLLLLHLLKRVGDILHPRVVVLQCFLNITDVEAHGRDLGCHRGLHTLPAGDDGMCGINTGPHLVKVDIDGIHCSSEVLHVTLTCQYDAADVIDFAFVVA